MDSTKVCRSFLAQAAQLATMCVTDQKKEAKWWKVACEYVRKAQEIDVSWYDLSTSEVKMLQTGVPEPIRDVFFQNSETPKQTTDKLQELPPAPSDWKHISLLEWQLKELKEECQSLPSLQEYQKLQEELVNTRQLHEKYLERSETNHQELQAEIKHMEQMLRDTRDAHEEAEDEATTLQIQFKKLQQKMRDNQSHYREKVRQLYTELEDKHYELESKTYEIDQLKRDLQRSIDLNDQLRSTVEGFQEVLKEFIPNLSDEQKCTLEKLLE